MKGKLIYPGIYPGRKVMLPSGETLMTVIGTGRDGRVWCDWEDDGGGVRAAAFAPEDLCDVSILGTPIKEGPSS
jgi:uncharacterized protein YodC (DUF2158 family)